MSIQQGVNQLIAGVGGAVLAHKYNPSNAAKAAATAEQKVRTEEAVKIAEIDAKQANIDARMDTIKNSMAGGIKSPAEAVSHVVEADDLTNESVALAEKRFKTMPNETTYKELISMRDVHAKWQDQKKQIGEAMVNELKGRMEAVKDGAERLEMKKAIEDFQRMVGVRDDSK